MMLSAFKVSGTVTDAGGLAVDNLRVRAFDRDMRSEQLLGEALTDADGRYCIEYSAKQFARAEKQSADLVVRVVDEKCGVIAESGTMFNGASEETIDIQLSPRQFPGKSEYERYREAICPVIEKVPVAELTEEDIKFLNREAEIPTDHLRFLQLDAAWTKSREIQPAVFYGLFRQGLSTNYQRLVAEKPARLNAALRASLEQNIIPQSIGEMLGKILPCLEQLAIEAASEHEDPTEPAPPGKLLATSQLKPQQQTALLRFALSYEGKSTTFWETAKADLDLDGKALDEARFAIEAGAIVVRHLPTLSAVQQIKRDKGWTDTRGMAQLSRDDWNGVVESSTVNGLPTGFENPKEYAEAIAYSVEQAMPTAVFAHNVTKAQIGSPDVNTFFAQNQDFDLVHTNVDGYFENGVNVEGIGDPETLRKQVKTFQRITRVVPRKKFYGTTEALVKAGYQSATGIHATGKRQFLEETVQLIDPEIATEIHARSGFVANVAGLTLQNARDFFDSPGPVFPGFRPEAEPNSSDTPEWAALFGNVSGCECEHCRSVYGPAAYLADLLKFIDDAPSAAVYDLLEERRPDIEHLLLNCDNANTPLPHIDIVNEILGDVVTSGTPSAHQTEDTAEELRARPAAGTENPTALATLASAEFPWTLPFDRDHEEAQLFAEHLGLDIAELRRVFSQSSEAIARAELGISSSEWTVLTALPADDAARAAQWGVTNLSDLRTVTTFLEKSGLSYSELEALCDSTFLSTEGAGEVTLERGADPCDISDDTLNGIIGPNPVLDQIHRFIRLSRHLGWPIESDNIPLDTVLRTLAHTSITEPILIEVARVRRLAKLARCSAAELVELDTARLAQALRTTQDELLLFAQLVGADLATTVGILNVVEKWTPLRDSGFDVRDLAYVLFGWDQIPAAIAPLGRDVDAFLADLHQVASAASTDTIEATIEENLARHVGMEPSLVGYLLAELVALSDPSQAAMADFRAWTSDPTLDDTHVRPLVFGFHRLARLLNTLSLGSRELAAVDGTRAFNGFLDFNALIAEPTDPAIPETGAETRFDSWQALVAAVRLRDRLPRGDKDLFDFLNDAAIDSAALTIATGWASADIEAVVGASADFSQLETYARLQRAMSWIRRFNIDGATLQTWAGGTAADLADNLRAKARAPFLDDDWYAVLTPISDVLREKTRDALLAYLIHHPDSPATFADASEVYAHYLIDVEMSSCQLTSRIVQASAAIQLLVQRLLMNLETVRLGSADSEHWKQWLWRKNYRVWEANRKVFLYPENWLEPELRDTKTPFFRELDNELLQDEITAETAERAYRNYLSKLDEVANLDVRGLYHDEDTNTLHVVARTYSVPHTYFYRKRLSTKEWTPWEAIDLQIEGDHLVPVVHNGRILLFWASFLPEASLWKIRFQWSEYKSGHWQPGQSKAAEPLLQVQLRAPGDDDVLRGKGFPKTGFFFRASEADTGLEIELFASYFGSINDRSAGANRIDAASSPKSYSIATFSFDSCNQRLKLRTDHDTVRLAARPPGTKMVGATFHAEDARLEIPQWVTGEDEVTYSRLPGFYDADGHTGPTITLAEYKSGFDDLLGPIVHLSMSTNSAALFERDLQSFSLSTDRQERHFVGTHPFFARLEERLYLATPSRADFGEGTTMRERMKFDFGELMFGNQYTFEVFYHPYLCTFVETLNKQGLQGLLDPAFTSSRTSLDRQRIEESSAASIFDSYRPNEERVLRPYPIEDIDFQAGAYSTYNWELFFHIPLLVATRLSKSQRFEEAQTWFHYIFDPTDVSDHPAPAKYWKPKPLYNEALAPPETIRALMQRLAAGFGEDVETQINAWEDDPFDPHAIARLRHLAYMRGVVMKYLDNLIAWGDSLFQQNTRESINEAAQLYVLAAEILGKRPITVSRPNPDAVDFATLRDDLGDFANALVDLESGLPADLPPGGSGSALPTGIGLYFCIPGNQKLAGYWDTIGDRLFKIRHCMNLKGQVQQLSLFAPPIDPALLVRAAALGLDIGQVLSQISDASLSNYRYPIVYQKALELAGDVRALGNALLSALEKKDSEDLALLRARHEGTLLEQIRVIKDQRVKEAEEAIEGLEHAKALAEARFDYYGGREFRNASETANVGHLHDAHGFEITRQGLSLAASIAHLIPQFHIQGVSSGSTFGGIQIGRALTAGAETAGIVASQYSFEANMASLLGSHQRRQDDWDFQTSQATIEIQQIAKQIVAAEIRLAIAENELENHDTQIEQSRETEAFLRRKFTNAELYGWMSTQLAALHHEAYRMAYDVAVKAEKAAQHQLGVEAGDFQFINFGHWDSQKKGLLAGERLHQELRRMDVAFMERNEREEEITRHISLLSLDPRKLLELRETGTCTFTVPEMLFDLDFPGHYRRRIKSASLTIPCVAGPYTSISARLTLNSSTVRAKGGAERTVTHAGKSIATSSAQNDSGIFELNFRDERWLPFEGAGAVSTWTLELPAPATLRPFDYDTISDVVLHMSYTASYDSGVKTRVEGDVEDNINSWIDTVPGFYRLLSLRQERGSELHQFLHPAAEATHHDVVITIAERDFPRLLQDRISTAHIEELTVIFKPAAELFPPAPDPSPFIGALVEAARAPLLTPPATGTGLTANPSWGNLPALVVTGSMSGSPAGEWALRLDPAALPAELRTEQDGHFRLRPHMLEDIFIAVRYTVPTNP